MTKKKQKNQKSGFNLLYIFAILVFVAGATFLCLSIFAPAKKTDDDTSSNTTTKETEKKKEDDKSEKKDDNNSENQDKTPKKYEEPSETDPSKINASITKNEISNGRYSLRVTMYELLNEGTCKLHMESSNGDTLDRSANVIIAGPDSSACEGFDVDNIKSYLNSGTYDFTVTINSGSKTGSVNGTIKVD